MMITFTSFRTDCLIFTNVCNRRTVRFLILCLLIISSSGRVRAQENVHADFEQEINKIFESTNQQRLKNGLAPLIRNDRLMLAAKNYASLMAGRGQLTHNVAGQTFKKRVAAVNYLWTYIGENIASNSILGGKDVVDNQWMKSDIHRENILTAQFTDIGIGISVSDKKGKQFFYCQIFGRAQ
jgi:uncharacterized protein YkwD